MNSYRDILERYKEGKISLDDAEQMIKSLNIEKIEELACFDIYREFRTGIPEVVFAESKGSEDIIQIIRNLMEKRNQIIISKLSLEKFADLKRALLPNLEQNLEITYDDRANLAIVQKKGMNIEPLKGKVGLITAGTSDIKIAEEARMLLEAFGVEVIKAYDVGIAGIHRIFPPLKEMIKNDVDIIIVIAGMEGTLPSVVASLVDVPVIGVPAPTGYGLGEKGLGALTTMLQSCSPGLVVVNIGNGFGAAMTAILFLKRLEKFRKIK